jgi:CheY-like chemotaxis protein
MIFASKNRGSQEEIREQCIRAGMNDYLPKPVKLNVLRTVLKEWLNRQ